MMLLYSPNHVFVWPGAVLLSLGITLHLLLILTLLHFGGRPASAVTGVFGTILSVVGFQILCLGLQAKTYSWSRRFDRNNAMLAKFYNHFKLETGLLAGAGLIATGGGILGPLLVEWIRSDLLPLPRPEWASFGATLTIIGFSTLFSSLLISAMSIRRVD